MTVKQPECSCGSKQAGLIFISDENRYQCGDCICRLYAKVAEICTNQLAIEQKQKEIEALQKKIEALQP